MEAEGCEVRFCPISTPNVEKCISCAYTTALTLLFVSVGSDGRVRAPTCPQQVRRLVCNLSQISRCPYPICLRRTAVLGEAHSSVRVQFCLSLRLRGDASILIRTEFLARVHAEAWAFTNLVLQKSERCKSSVCLGKDRGE